LFFASVVLTIFLCGAIPALVAAILSVLSAWLFILPHELTDFTVMRTLHFCAGSLAVIAVSAVMHAVIAKMSALNETLQLSEEKFRGLLESAPDAMIITGERDEILLVNARTEELFGYPRTDLIGKPIAMLIPAHGPAATEAAGQISTLHARTAKGREFPIELTFGHLATKTGRLVSNAIRDITERRRIEASLVEASKAKSEFLARMSHELRTPLNAIIGFSELIRDAMIAPIDARYREYGGDIHNAGKHLLNIVNDILDIAKIEDGRLELREEVISIAESIEACRRVVAVMAEAASVTLIADAAQSLPRIRCDQIRFRQVLLNLMSNAVKFTPAGGEVRVSAATGPEGVIITVTDTGIGMKPEEIAIALEPFRQIEGPMSRRFDGTGLGLPLAKALVELHDGHLQIESAAEKGTTVRVCLPAHRIREEAA
jgi:protein-histidine pros-kinase